MSGFVQIAENFDATSTLHVTLSLGPFSSPTTAGNRIVVLVLFNDTTGGTGSVPSITDTALNTYTPIGNAGTGLFDIFVSGQYMAYAFEVESSAANAANTVLVTWSLVTGLLLRISWVRRRLSTAERSRRPRAMRLRSRSITGRLLVR